MLLETLSYIGQKFNDNGIVWAVGASIVLQHYGLIDEPNDIDILVDLKDIEKADEILKSIGEKKKWEKSDKYSTKYFYEYVIKGIDVDVMSGLKIKHENGIYEYIFDNNSISAFKEINGVSIPLTSLEDWYILYQLIPNRETKVNMIENYLLSNGVKRCDLLKRALSEELSIKVRRKVEAMI